MRDTLTRLCLRSGAQHLHTLGSRAVAAFIEDLSARIGGLPAAVGLLAEYKTKPVETSSHTKRRERVLSCPMADAASGARQG